MRIVLDTNVLVSGIFFSGPPSKVLKAWKRSEVQIVFSEEILEEYRRVAENLSEKYPSIDIYPILELLMLNGSIIDTSEMDISICADPDDDKFVECAVAGRCQVIITGDKHLLDISGYRGIQALKPRAFVDSHLEKKNGAPSVT